MKNLGAITDPKDIITKEFLEEGIGVRVNTLEDNLQMAESDIETLQGDVQSLQTDNTATKAAVQTLQDTYVPNTRKVNNKALDADITLTASDVGALSTSGGTVTGQLNFQNYPRPIYFTPYSNSNPNDKWGGSITPSVTGFSNTIGLSIAGGIPKGATIDSGFEDLAGAQIGTGWIITGKNGIEIGGSTRSTLDTIEYPATYIYGVVDPTADTMAANKQYVDNAIPTKTSQLTNDSGFLTSAPVTSVNSQTGAVILTASDINAMPIEGIASTVGFNQIQPYTFDGEVSIDNLKFIGNVNANSKKISALSDPVNAQDAATKNYVDGLAIYTISSTSVPITTWVTNTNSQATTQEKIDFPFMATISLVDVTTDYCVDVLFSYDDQISGNFCPCVYSVAGGVIVEAKEKPSAAITIPVIRYWKPIARQQQQGSSGSNTP